MKTLFGTLLCAVIVSEVTSIAFAQAYPRGMEKFIEQTDARKFASLIRKTITAEHQLEQEQAFKELQKLRSVFSAGCAHYSFLNTLFLTYKAKNSLRVAKIHHSRVLTSHLWWPEDGTYVDSFFQKNIKRTSPNIERALDNIQRKELNYRVHKFNLELLKRQYPALAKKYADLTKNCFYNKKTPRRYIFGEFFDKYRLIIKLSVR